MSRLPHLLLLPLLVAMSATPVRGDALPDGVGGVLRVGDVQLLSQRHWWWLMAGVAALRFDTPPGPGCGRATTIAAHVSPRPGVDSMPRPSVSAPAVAPVRSG